MRKTRVVMVPFTYPDYPTDVVSRFIEDSRKTVASAHPDVVVTNRVASLEEAASARRAILDSDPDLIIALLVSWVEAPNLVACLRDFFGKPILLWSHTTYNEDGVGLTLGAIPAAGVIRFPSITSNASSDHTGILRYTANLPGLSTATVMLIVSRKGYSVFTRTDTFIPLMVVLTRQGA